MKVFLTGEKGVGKSTCINEIIKECRISVSGFQTLPFYEYGSRKGFYMHALFECENNDMMFSIQHETCNEVIENVFNTFGVSVLKESMNRKDTYLILDEIGFLEQNEKQYLEYLENCIQNFDNIIGVLKKCEIQYIKDIKAREDVIILDFDVMSYKEVKEKLKKYVEDK